MIDVILWGLVLAVAVAAVRTRDLVSATMLLGAYSLLMCIVWTRLNAVDVAFTESAVGAGISTVLLLASIARTKRFEAARPRPKGFWRHWVPLAAVVCTGGLLVYGTTDLPAYGDADSIANTHAEVARYYLEHTYAQFGENMPNVVTSTLAHYRGYDTMGETTVIFVAAMVVILLLRPLGRDYGTAAQHHPEHAPAPTAAEATAPTETAATDRAGTRMLTRPPESA